MVNNTNTYIPWQQPENFIFQENWFIWLSHKLWNDGKVLDAFDTSTTSWKILSSIQQKSKHSITMLNLVPWVPLDENGKLRYPSATEKTLWYRILKDKILTYKPKKCFLFWKHVQDLFIKDSDVIQKDDCYKLGETALIFMSHPSYIYAYRKSEISSYEEDVLSKLS